jgi:hypothetical protein
MLMVNFRREVGSMAIRRLGPSLLGRAEPGQATLLGHACTIMVRTPTLANNAAAMP